MAWLTSTTTETAVVEKPAEEERARPVIATATLTKTRKTVHEAAAALPSGQTRTPGGAPPWVPGCLLPGHLPVRQARAAHAHAPVRLRMPAQPPHPACALVLHLTRGPRPGAQLLADTPGH